ncbi:hypothetical protein FQR65_LT10162 [Abscondita terminalis]|nr:hypothetical protein FQR65_LT10162 [Abscondita terminalis]
MRGVFNVTILRRMYSQMELLRNKAFVNGEWVNASDGKSYEVYNPATNTLVGNVPDMNVKDVDDAIKSAADAFATWQNTTNKERSHLLRKWFNTLEESISNIADIITAESGKPLQEAKVEVTYGNSFIEFFSEEARRIHGEIIPSPVTTKRLMAVKQPIGVVALITPWNFPYAMIARKAAAALASGCTCIIKPSEETPFTALAMAISAEKAGIPKGVFNVITSDLKNSIEIGKLLCESPLTAGISFTGSTRVGKILYSQCASGLKRMSLELGGNAPFIVFNSANLDNAINGAIASKFRNCGQTCVASNRFLIQDDVHDCFVQQFAQEIGKLKIGCGTDPGIQVGPLINETQFRRMNDLVDDAVSKGAKVIVGGKPATKFGKLFYEPTLLINITENMRLYREEAFGPIVPIIRFKTEEEGLAIANATEFGLASYFYSEDVNQIFRVSRAIESGMVGVNEGIISTAEAPFGGIKQSGFGREGSTHGIDDFTYIKYICVVFLHSRLQDVDGSFFERFGSILRDRSEYAKHKDRQNHIRATTVAKQFLPREFLHSESELPSPPHSEVEKELQPEPEPEPIHEPESIPEDLNIHVDINTVNNEFSATLDSEHEESQDSNFYTVGMNIDELYVELLYQILHNVGCDVNYEVGQTALFSYIQDAFKMSNDKHNEMLSTAEKREPPELLLNVKVVEAKDLVPMDSNGLSDPFVTLYLASNTVRRYNSSVKTETLNPVWEEHFALPVNNDNNDDFLCVEVWDFDPAETMKEKFGKILKVKGIRGVRRLFKEMAVTAATGQHENEIIGSVKIPIRNIPSAGMLMWYGLDKKNKSTRQGVIKLDLSFGSEKNKQVAAQEHKHLINLLLLHEIDSSQIPKYAWIGKFSPQAEAILTQHKIQSGLTSSEMDLTQWAAFTSIQKEHPLAFSVYVNLLDNINKHFKLPSTTEEEVKYFGTFPKNYFLHAIAYYENSSYPWLDLNDEDCSIVTVLKSSVIKGAKEWLQFILERTEKQNNTDDETLVYFHKIVQLIRTDLQRAVEYDKMFQGIVNFEYAKTLYDLYQREITNLVENEVVTICKSLKSIAYDWNCLSQCDANDPMSLGTKLFELYLALQRFVCLGSTLFTYDIDDYEIKNCHKWFHGGVQQWLDIAVVKAMQRIEKAVELDDLSPVDDSVKYSSSALDTLTIFHQIRIFWDQLNWPDIEGCYGFVAKIIDDLCRCCLFYADKMAIKVEGMGEIEDAYEKRFEVTKEWCLAINNIDYVCQSLKPFTEELKLDSIIQQLSEIRNPLEAERCNATLQNVLESSLDTIQNKILELLEKVATKMGPAMKKLLIEGAELLNQDSNSIDRVMRYLDNNLATLYEELNEDNFNRILEIIWGHLGNILYELIQSNIEKRRPPAFFANLRATLQLMVKSFKQSDESNDCENLQKIERLLKINGLETSALIHEVHLDRWREQALIKSTPYGELSVRLQFQNNDLIIEVINARNLLAMDSNGFSDSFVRINLLPEEKFTHISKPKTQTHNKNLFPLYDELFTLNLSPDLRHTSNGLVQFCVKDKDFLGMSNQFIGEAFVHFKDIPDTNANIRTLPQVRLLLHRPSNQSTDCVSALENRQGDKLAKEFLKRLKLKHTGSSGS